MARDGDGAQLSCGDSGPGPLLLVLLLFWPVPEHLLKKCEWLSSFRAWERRKQLSWMTEAEGPVLQREGKHHSVLIKRLAQEVGCKPEDIVDFELNVCDTQPGVIGGGPIQFAGLVQTSLAPCV